jgi:hypothetical protein
MKQAGFYFFANHMNDPIVESLDAGKARRVALRFVALRCGCGCCRIHTISALIF